MRLTDTFFPRDIRLYNSVTVEVSGPKADGLLAFASFEEMFRTFRNVLPAAIEENVRRCQYHVPTPVQKHAIPIMKSCELVYCATLR